MNRTGISVAAAMALAATIPALAKGTAVDKFVAEQYCGAVAEAAYQAAVNPDKVLLELSGTSFPYDFRTYRAIEYGTKHPADPIAVQGHVLRECYHEIGYKEG